MNLLELVGKLRFRVTKRAARRGLPHDRYTAGGARFLRVNEDLRYVVPCPQVDLLDAIRHNHEVVRDAAEAAGVATFVVDRPVDRGVVLGIRAGDERALLEALLDRASSEPLYVRARSVSGRRRVGAAVTRIPEQLADPEALEHVEVFRYLREPSTGQSFGPKQACRFEVWPEDANGALVAPSLNGRVGTLTRADRLEPVTVDVHGERGATYAVLAARTALEVDFPVDVVYLWVDGGDPAWQARKGARLAALTGAQPGEDAVRAVRFEQSDELRFSLRALHRFAPWVRRIFLVTDQQRPGWLVERPGKLDVVDHRDFLPAEGLPTFNSHAISAGLHRIEGLAEHFLVFNDDVLLGRPVAPETFFLSNGVARFFPSRSALPSDATPVDDLPLVAARKRSQELIAARTGLRPNFGFKHTPIALRRGWLAELEREVPEWARTLRSPFRSATDIVPEWLHHWAGYAEGRCLPSDIDYAYFDIGSERAVRRLRTTILRAQRPEVLCVNDVTDATPGGTDRHENLNRVLGELFPHRSPYEVAE